MTHHIAALALLLLFSVSAPLSLADGPDKTAVVPGPLVAPATASLLRIRRDPFRSLIVPPKEGVEAVTPAAPKPRPPGLPGLSSSEIAVIGIASNPKSRLAVLQNKEKATYFGKVGDRLYDGYISDIDGDKVSIIVEFTGSDGKKSQTTLTKRLYAEM